MNISVDTPSQLTSGSKTKYKACINSNTNYKIEEKEHAIENQVEKSHQNK